MNYLSGSIKVFFKKILYVHLLNGFSLSLERQPMHFYSNDRIATVSDNDDVSDYE